jgi:hypothetical protein
MKNKAFFLVFTMGIVLAALAVSQQGSGHAQDSPRQYFVDPVGSDGNNGLTPTTAFRSIQYALSAAQPGDTIHLAPADFHENIETVRDGREDAPITITGTSASVITGTGGIRIFQVFHDYITLQGFTIDGRREDFSENSEDGYFSKLLYAEGLEPNNGITGLRLLNMHFRNAGEECVRLRYFIQYSEVAYSTFDDCGIYHFQLDGDGKVGEGIYLGTSSEQWEENPTNEPDQSAHNWIHHNRIETHGNECIEMKEGTHDNIVEHNICTEQEDDNSAGIGSRGSNIIRYNEIYDNEGAGIRLGGHEVDGVQYGTDNLVYGNNIYDNEEGGIKIEAEPQGMICGNKATDNSGGSVQGEFRDGINPQATCDDEAIQSQPISPF